MNKRKLLPLLIAACLLLVTLCGGVLAYMFRRTEQKKNTFTPAVVDCVVDEAFDGAKKTAIAVTNTGNIDDFKCARAEYRVLIQHSTECFCFFNTG